MPPPDPALRLERAFTCDPANLSAVSVLEAHDGGVRIARILRGNGPPRLISAWGDGTIRIWAISEPEEP